MYRNLKKYQYNNAQQQTNKQTNKQIKTTKAESIRGRKSWV